MSRIVRGRRRSAARLLGLTLLALAASSNCPADAASCRNGNELVQPGGAMCLDGFTNTCQPNGAWIADRQWPCMEPVFPEFKSCVVERNRTAAPGAHACIAGKRRECSETGIWIDNGPPC
jgi:hypothetical protein